MVNKIMRASAMNSILVTPYHAESDVSIATSIKINASLIETGIEE